MGIKRWYDKKVRDYEDKLRSEPVDTVANTWNSGMYRFQMEQSIIAQKAIYEQRLLGILADMLK